MWYFRNKWYYVFIFIVKGILSPVGSHYFEAVGDRKLHDLKKKWNRLRRSHANYNKLALFGDPTKIALAAVLKQNNSFFFFQILFHECDRDCTHVMLIWPKFHWKIPLEKCFSFLSKCWTRDFVREIEIRIFAAILKQKIFWKCFYWIMVVLDVYR